MNKLKTEIKNVFLNHTYFIVSENMYDEIKKSDFLKNEFCHCQEKTHMGELVGEKTSWTGFYITGESTYFELFSDKYKKNLQQMGCGEIGIAFSVDRKEEIEGVVETFKKKFVGDVNYNIFSNNIDGDLVSWFYYVEVANNLSLMPQVDSWVMAYHEDYFKGIKTANRKSITRKEYNSSCNAVLFDKGKLFKDIEEITLLLNNENREKFVELQRLFDYTCKDDRDCIICQGPRIVFTLKRSLDETCKLLELRMSLNREVGEPKTYKFGNSTMKLEHKTAVWRSK